MAAWKVTLHGKEIDTVFGHEGSDASDVKRSLVNHDGYDSSIVVTKKRAASSRSKRAKPYRSGTRGGAMKAIREIQHILWPGGNADAEWSSDDIERVAMAVERHGFGPHR
jgi:hypothetical protein